MQHITLFIPLGRDISLLRRNLDYYTEMGVQRFLLSVHIIKEWHDGFLRAVEEIIADFPAVIAETHSEEHIASKKRYENVINTHCNDNDWVIVADLDEFYEYSLPLPDVVQYCEQNNYDYVTGEFLDRVGPEGGLPDIHGDLWDTYPVGLRLTSHTNACANKIVLARAHIELTGGHHNALSGTGCPAEECSAIVHHFKWDSTCIERSKYVNRMQKKAGKSWAIDSERILHYLESNRMKIPVDDPILDAYWPMYKRKAHVADTGLDSIFSDPIKIIPRILTSSKIKELSKTEYLVSNPGGASLKLNHSSMMIFNLCNGRNSVSDIVSITREAYPTAWSSIENHVQSALRSFYAMGLLSCS
ncbi:MAG: hypothetical protein BMS9Abin25_0610 [Gammaproteobacteria bacterium]|nr:MAG: hypothetical protein BMS9Abin25_0610 [Gammaproteobacteria bacterium]